MADVKHKKADITAVARAARVSPSTVSRCFNHPDLVKPSTRKKIDSAIRRLGYIRNRAAQTIHGIRSGTIGLVVPTIDHAIFAEVVQAFSDSVDAHGFTILLATHGYDLEREYAVLRKLFEHRVDGVALVGLHHSEETFHLIESQNMPSVLIWNYSDQSRLPSVGADNHLAGRVIARHVIDLGHRDIALLFPPMTENDRAAERLSGVEIELERAGLSSKPEWRFETPYSISAAKDAAGHILDLANRPTAIICGNDVLAWGAMHAARNRGIDIPDALSVAGIGDFRGSKDLEPALTTVRLPARQIGRSAGETIAKAVTQPEDPVLNHGFDPEFIKRATCARPPLREPKLG